MTARDRLSTSEVPITTSKRQIIYWQSVLGARYRAWSYIVVETLTFAKEKGHGETQDLYHRVQHNRTPAKFNTRWRVFGERIEV